MRWLTFSLLAVMMVQAANGAQYGTTKPPTADDDIIATVIMVDGDTDKEKPDTVTAYDRRIHRYRRNWQRLIPTQSVIQYAGNMGLISVGMGWEYGRRKQWETHLLVGFLPKFGSDHSKATMTLKENFIPWSISIGDTGWAVEPLSCGLYVNTVFGSEFWNKQPDRYPQNYYPFLSTKIRFNIFVGQRLEFTLPKDKRKFVKGITAFYELSTCDLYLRTMIKDSKIKLTDIVGLSLGLKFQLF